VASPPTRFGKYRLYDRIAVGGMAEIFFATKPGDPELSGGCIIKRVLPHLAGEKQFITMFLDEAKLTARLHHPGIARIYDLGIADEQYFIAMEYLFGEDCASLIEAAQKKGITGSWPVACAIVAQAAEVLHFAHEAKGADGAPLDLVHRDVSPSNVFVTYDGNVKILDFGIARWAQKVGQTQVGFVKGKAGYMAPEQAEGHVADRRSDVWALGVCLFELLCARPLFLGETTLEVAVKALQGNVTPPSTVALDVPRELDAIALKALAPDPRQRFATAGELAAALQPLLPPRPQTAIAKRMRFLFGSSRKHPLSDLDEQPTEAIEVRRLLPAGDPDAAKTIIGDPGVSSGATKDPGASAGLTKDPGESAGATKDNSKEFVSPWEQSQTENLPLYARGPLKSKGKGIDWRRAAIAGGGGGLLLALLLIIARC
jgi:eukaryotic-like serine/threonine-protein kinase